MDPEHHVSSTPSLIAGPHGEVLPLRLRRSPLLAAALAFGLGILSAHRATPPTLVLTAALAFLAVLAIWALLRRSARPSIAAAFAVLGVWFALGVAAGAWQPAPSAPAALLGYSDNLSRTVRAKVIRVQPAPAMSADAVADADAIPPWEAAEELPAGATGSGRRASLDLDVTQVEDVTPDRATLRPVTGGIRVSVFPPRNAPAAAAPVTLRCGDQVELPLRMRPPDRFRDPGTFDYGDYLLEQGIAARAGVSADRIVVTGHAAASVRCRLYAAQNWASTRLAAFIASPVNHRLPRVLELDASDGAMLDAMLFGDRSGLTHALRVGFERTGSFHLFVVSGLHIALLAGIVFTLARRLRIPRGPATLLTLLAAGAYTAVTGFGEPALRSLGMTAVYLLARLLSRDRDPLNALGAAVLAILLWSPRALFDSSLEMTVLVIVAIGGVAVPLGHRSALQLAGVSNEVFRHPRRLFSPRVAQLRLNLELWSEALGDLLGPWAARLPTALTRFLFWVGELALIGLVAELIMVLPMAVFFHRATLFSLPANMLVIPVIALLAPLGVITFVCSLVSPWLALVPGAGTAGFLHLLRWAIGLASHLDAADLRVPPPPLWAVAVALVGWAVCLWAVRRGRLGAVATAFVLPAIAALVLWPRPPITVPGALELTAIDVGQGDSLLAVNPQGAAMLIDAGGPVGSHGASEIVANFDVGDEVVAPYLWSRRFRHLDVLVLSHAHTDHMGGMPAVLRAFRPRELWVGSTQPRSALFNALLAEAARLGVIVRRMHAGDRLPWGSVAVTALAPAANYTNGGSPKNDDSLALELDLGRASVLLEGDAERPSEDAMLAAGALHPVTLLKVGHHGSRTSTNPEFLAAVHPVDAVVSVGRGNTFGHPRADVLERLQAAGTHVFRTDEFGLTTFLLTPDGAIHERVGDVDLPGRPTVIR